MATDTRDWRAGYIVCQHVADGDWSTNGTRHRGFRVCCEECYQIEDERGIPRFLFDEELDREERHDGFCVGRLKRS